MLIERVLYPIVTLGPGKRLVIWTAGCSKHCKNCANPELWSFDRRKNIAVEKLSGLIHKVLEGKKLDGVTISGGDPLEQASELIKLLRSLCDLCDDFIVYTGYTEDELKKTLSVSEYEALKSVVTLLIDGPYVHELNDNKCVLRGSANQKLIFYDAAKKEKYQNYLSEGRKIQNVFCEDKIISVGIHNNEK